jgi:2-hydroxychromene-2-carboxylate isomerase
MQTIEYFIAPQSPYCYFGHARLAEIAKKHGAQVQMKPMDLGGKVFPVSGGLPVAQRPAQRLSYRLVELKRWAEHLNIPFNIAPKYFPVSGDTAAKMMIAAPSETAAFSFAGAVLKAVWADELNIADDAVLVSLANQCGLDGAAMLQSAPSMQAKYDSFSQQAIDAKVFGAPWFVLNGEPFWGQDRLDFLDRALATNSNKK